MYVVVPGVDVLITAGLQVPLMLLLDVTGNAGATEFRQSEPNGVKVGVTFGDTVTSRVVACGTLTRIRGEGVCRGTRR